ncbi:MAG TPA: hypothetical protein VMH81_36300 [Bryobacteraceae bacterium]|nr:hypothetical protein [Bryobacteraceae bacterium]
MMAATGSKQTRGPNKQPPWRRDPMSGVSVLRLPLDISDPLQRERLEGLFAAAFCLRRALQRDARSRLGAYWAAHHERAAKGSAAVRKRLGLSREALERAAYRHLSRAPHLRLHATKAMAMHLADSVWVDVKRHLFADSRGRRSGKPKVGRWHRFHRIPGRARSHTRPRKWETFQLHGTLSGHQKAYTGTDGRFFQPHSMRPVLAPGSSWFRHQGALVVVFTGLGSGELVLPVRLPISPCNQRILEHYLSDPDRWHKIDLVRRQDPTGRWRYEAHLMVLTAPYASPTTVEWRAIATRLSAGRQAGIDVNVSNISVASHQNGQDLRISRFERDAGDRESAGRLAARKRRRERALERSRRAANPEQYHLSKRQEERAQRRVEAGLPTPPVIPKGPRKARSDGRPLRAFRKDRLSRSYRRTRAALAADAASTAQAKRDRARWIAKLVVLWHGLWFAVEACNLSAWARLWGRALHAFSPGTLLAAIKREAAAAATQACLAAGFLQASTRETALSQHCLCGQRVEKTLSERTHYCPRCGLAGDRDAISATLAAFLVFEDPADPSTAAVDFAAAKESLRCPATRALLGRSLNFVASGRQDARSESTAKNALDGSSVEETWRTPSPSAMVARRNVGTALRPTPDETSLSGWTTPDRTQARTDLSSVAARKLPPLRDSS